MNRKLYPNCSEYVCRIKLTNAEKQYAKEWARKRISDEQERKYLEEYLEEDNCESTFTDEGLSKVYLEIITKIETLRETKFDSAELRGVLTKEEIQDIKEILNKKGLPLEWEIEQIINDYPIWKSLITKLMIVEDLQKGKKNRWDEDDY